MELEWWYLWIPFGGTVLGILLNIFLGIRQNKKNAHFREEFLEQMIDVNLKASARFEWIKEVRKLSASFITTAYEFANLKRKYIQVDEENFILYTSPDPDFDSASQNTEELDKLYNDILSLMNVLLLYFNDDKHVDEFNAISNRRMIYRITQLSNQVNALYSGDAVIWTDFHQKGILPFRNDMREYLRAEWDRAQNGE